MKLAILDSSYLIYKSFFAFNNKQLTITKDGKTLITSPIFGFLRELIRLASEQPYYDFIIAAWDHPPYNKVQIFRGYKEKRKQAKIPDLSEEKTLLKAILCDLNIPCLAAKGYEGEEVAASIISAFRGNEINLYTNDEDCYVLLSPDTSIINGGFDKITKQVSINKFTTIDLERKYNVTPAMFRQMKILMGCRSDEVPGIPGIGHVKASALINQWGTVKSLLSNIDSLEKVNPKLAKKIIDANDSGILKKSKILTRIEQPKNLLAFSPKESISFLDILAYIEANSFTKGNNKLVLKNLQKKQSTLTELFQKRLKWNSKNFS